MPTRRALPVEGEGRRRRGGVVYTYDSSGLLKSPVLKVNL